MTRSVKVIALIFLALPLSLTLATRGTAAGDSQRGQGETVKKSDGDKAASKSEEKPEARAFVTGNIPVLLEKPLSPLSQIYSGLTSWFKGTATQDRYLWTCFSLRPKADASQSRAGISAAPDQVKVLISASGLGPTYFANKAAGGCSRGHTEGEGPDRECKVFVGEGGGWTKGFSCWEPALELPLDQPEEIIGVRVPVGLVQQAGGTVEGKIIVQELGRKPLEIPLKVERPADPFSTGLQWFGGIALPALISFGLGYGASKLNTRLSSRTEQQTGFTIYKDENYSTLNPFFKNFYPAQCQLYPNDWSRIAEELTNEMRSKGILRHIPQKERKKLEDALARGNEAEIKKSLLALFKEWGKIINNPGHGQNAGGG